MEGITNTMELVRPWLAYLDYCLNQYPAAAVCEPFWTRLIIAVILVGVLAVVVGAWKYLKYRRDYRAALRADYERQAIADPTTMQASTWDGDKAYRAELTEEDVTKQIRAALDARRRGEDHTPGSRGA